MSSSDAFRIEAVALDLARTIVAQRSFHAPPTVADVVRELLLAVISSRVRWEVASAIVGDLLSIMHVCSAPWLEVREGVRSAVARHRHPRRIAQWLETLLADDRRMLNLALETLMGQEEPHIVRRRLAAEVAGVGPKQASLLLRNLGTGQRLAVLDRHVMRFMELLGISVMQASVASIAGYERMEAAFVAYADYRRVSADALDLAVWVVMRTAAGRILRGHRDAGLRGARLDACGCFGGGGGPDTISALH